MLRCLFRPRAASASALASVSLALMLVAVPTLGAPTRLAAQESGAVTSGVFRRFGDYVVKIQVVETGSAAKASLGSGFYVSDRGHVVTNYHVISKLVHEPARYRAELIDTKGASRAVRILAVDVVHDLAVLGTDAHPDRYFTLEPVQVAQGTRLYSLGHPNDLGLSIVEGTYNGLLQHTLYPKIHFTGSINHGMSGGPTLTESGRVIGINVSTAGNQVSFLVPAERAASLLARATAPGYTVPKSLLGEIGRQIIAYQDVYLARLFADSTPSVMLGKYSLPTQPAPFFKCWGDATRNKDLPYEIVTHRCSTDDYVYITSDQSSGVIDVSHRLVSSAELNPVRFFALYSKWFEGGTDDMDGSEEDVTSFRCESRNVAHRGLVLRAALCIRRYRKLPGLYDAVLKAATLGHTGTGVLTTLSLSGVSFANAQALSRRYLESLAWHE